MRLLLKISLSILLFIFLGSVCFAADHAIMIGNTYNGDGTTWGAAASADATGAYNDLPTTLIRGDVYYISEGTLIVSYYNLNVAESGTSTITIRKAVAAAHGPSTGWLDSMGDAQTIFSSSTSDGSHNGIFNIYNATDYYVFDGVSGSGSDPDSYGFKFIIGTMPPQAIVQLFYGGNGTAANYTISHCAFIGPYPTKVQCSRGIEGGEGPFLIEYCLFQGFDNAVHGFTNNLTIDNTWFTKTWGGGDQTCHGQQISYNQDNLTVTNSVFEDSGDVPSVETAFITFNDARDPGFGADGWRIYNNIFINNKGGGGILTNASSGGTYITDLLFYHNTIVDGDGKLNLSGEGADVIVKNNIWWGANMALDSYSFIHDYNYWNSTCTNKPTETNGQTEAIEKTDLFTDPSNNDYTLKVGNLAINNALDLGASYNTDKDGITRPQDGSWDMGAYEFTGSAAPTGTLVVAGGIVESEVVNGGKTIILTLTGTTWDIDIGNSGAETTALIAGITSNKSGATYWNDVVRAGLAFGDVTRNSDTVVTILLPAFAAYQITESETIEVTIDSTCVASATQIVASPTFIVSVDTLPDVTGVGAHIVAGGLGATLTTGGVKITSP